MMLERKNFREENGKLVFEETLEQTLAIEINTLINKKNQSIQSIQLLRAKKVAEAAAIDAQIADYEKKILDLNDVIAQAKQLGLNTAVEELQPEAPDVAPEVAPVVEEPVQ